MVQPPFDRSQRTIHTAQNLTVFDPSTVAAHVQGPSHFLPASLATTMQTLALLLCALLLAASSVQGESVLQDTPTQHVAPPWGTL